MTGEKSRRRKAFFIEHSTCCFCAGEAAAVEQDHQPGRVFFSERQWPEGFVFPACKACNEATRYEEAALGALIGSVRTDRDKAVLAERVRSLSSNRPDLSIAILTTRQKRNFINKSGIRPTGVPIADLPLIRLNKDTWQPVALKVAHKLFLALHYQCFGQPLSRSGEVWVWVYTNADHVKRAAMEQMLEIADGFVTPVRGNTELTDQFSIRWSADLEARAGVWNVHLQAQFFFSGFTTERDNSFEAVPPNGPLRPYHWGGNPPS